MSKNDSLACYSDWMENMSLNGKSIFEKRDYMGSNPAVGRFFIHSGGEAGFKGVLQAYLPNSLAVIVAVVFVSRILHRLLRFSKQPLIVCQLITGIFLFSLLPKDGKSNDVGIAIHPANLRVNHILAKIGVLFNLFILGVKFDVNLVQVKKTPIIIGLGCVVVPFAAGLAFALLKYKELGFQDKDQHELMFFTVYVLSSTYPISIYEILSEMNLLNSELGRMALSSSIAQLIPVLLSTLAIVMVKQSQTRIFDGFLALMTYFAVSTIAVVVIRSYSLWIVRTTGPYARVRGVHLWLISTGMLLTALLGDLFGFLSHADIAMIMGLIIPTGPPLGTALIEQLDLVTSQVLLPIIFLQQGFYMDWTLIMQKISVTLWLGSLVLLTFVAKFVSIVALSRYCKLPLKKGILLAVIMNFRGFLDMLCFLNLASIKAIHEITFSGMVLWNLPITAICSPVVAACYKPLEATNQTRIQTVEERAETRGDLSVMACFFDDKPVPALLDFLETNNLTYIYSLHLVESQGTAVPNLIDHRNADGVISTLHMHPVHNHFITLESQETMETMGTRVKPFTSIASLNSMLLDICSLVLNNNISFVIVPYPKRNSIANLEASATMHDLLPLVLEKAPCTVGIMVYSGTQRIIGHSSWVYRVAVIFWGGPDDREAIAIASRMACHPSVQLTVIHFLTSPSTANQKDNDDDTNQKAPDVQMITMLRVANKENNRVNVSEIIVQNAEKVMSVMLDVDNEKYDLLIVGRRQKCSSIFGDKWVNWIESPELGVMGDLVSTGNSDMTNVLIVQQHMEGIKIN